MDGRVSIRVVDNGVVLQYDDPEILASNKGDGADYMDPSKEMVFTSVKDALPQAERILKKLMGEETSDDEFASAFDEATTDE